jgi:hypothetical protein
MNIDFDLNDWLNQQIASAIAADYNYVLAFLLVAGAMMVVAVLPVIAGYYLGWKKPPVWSVLLLASVSGLLFVGSVNLALKTPGNYYNYYEDLFRHKYQGTPDDVRTNCPVYQSDGQSYRLVPLLDADGNEVYREVTDAEGKAKKEPVMTKVKEQYVLYARPFGQKEGYPRIYLNLGNRSIYNEPHLCALDMNKNNFEFMKKAQKAWDEVHGQEPEKPGEQGEQGQQQGEQGEQQGQQGQGQPSKRKSPITIELPDQGEESGDSGSAEAEGEEGQPGEGEGEGEMSDAEAQNNRRMQEGSVQIAPSNDGEDRRGANRDSEGSITGGLEGPGLPPKH